VEPEAMIEDSILDCLISWRSAQMRHESQREHMRTRTATEPESANVSEFARRHQITPGVAKAILANAKTPDEADRAVAKMRG
jgi:hypothetical protein